MTKEIVMPKLGNTVESVVIVEWHKDVGDFVAAGDILCEVETDKATVEVEADAEGTLLARLFEENDEVEVLKPFAVVGDAGEDLSSRTSLAASETAAGLSGEAAPGISPRARNLAGLDGYPPGHRSRRPNH